MEDLKNSELAEAAAELIEKHGHIKGNYGGPSQGFCLTGAGRWVGQTQSFPVTRMSGIDARFLMMDKAEKQLVNLLWSLLPVEYRMLPLEPCQLVACTDCAYHHRFHLVLQYNDEMLDKEGAIDLLTQAAKYWRDKGE